MQDMINRGLSEVGIFVTDDFAGIGKARGTILKCVKRGKGLPKNGGNMLYSTHPIKEEFEYFMEYPKYSRDNRGCFKNNEVGIENKTREMI